ncbi:NAD(P)-dependent oxidoreductase [Acetobacter tropicalis]|nr:NAD(P)-dependent oxidoreductase [Acetobacter tropicalis]KAA8384250.1 NAD(P)-dependent oxidoreductase [Acetobacter tropicalis]KAA8391353.1 NAD(P)-dependent oxidoreductase [Acetobacter tropicalis]MBC9008925.1 NAD(P)-dependent oxidoreductase [Acetobacter tropicalis]MDO8172415.1 NAD(P)-dependent oxidoreductase [Acetobacter tropicalis]
MMDNKVSPKFASPLIGVVGLGRMGSNFAQNMLESGFQVVVYDRNPPRVAALVTVGAQGASVLSDLASCEIILTALSDDQAMIAVCDGPHGLLASMGAGAVHVSTGTISPEAAEALERKHEACGQAFVSAPVLGNPDLARQRLIFVLAAGKMSAMKKVMPILEALSQKICVIAEQPEKANILKLAANVLTALTMQGMGEVLVLLRKSGFNERDVFEVLTGTLFDSRVHKGYGGKIMQKHYLPAGMTLPLAVKDLRLALLQAEKVQAVMPTAAIVHDRLVGMCAQGWENLDWSALGLLTARDSGLADDVPGRDEE